MEYSRNFFLFFLQKYSQQIVMHASHFSTDFGSTRMTTITHTRMHIVTSLL